MSAAVMSERGALRPPIDRKRLRELQRAARGDAPEYRAALAATEKARAALAAVEARLAGEQAHLTSAKAALASAVGTPTEAAATAELRAIKNAVDDLADLAAAAQSTVDRLAAAEAKAAPTSLAALEVKAAAVQLFQPYVDALRGRILRNQEALAADRLALCALNAEGVHSSTPNVSTPFGLSDPATAPLKLPTRDTWRHARMLPAPELAAFRALLSNADAQLPALPD